MINLKGGKSTHMATLITQGQKAPRAHKEKIGSKKKINKKEKKRKKEKIGSTGGKRGIEDATQRMVAINEISETIARYSFSPSNW